MQHIEFKTNGTCSESISIDLSGDIIEKIHFEGGCPGNLRGLERLAKGMRVQDLIERLEGIECGTNASSCPDQLAKALKQHFNP